MAIAAGVGMTPEDLFNALAYDNVLPTSFMERIRWTGGDIHLLADHFEAILLADLGIPYTLTVVGGGTATLYLDDEPSAVRLATGAVMNDNALLESDRTVSLQGLGGQTLIFETRLKLNSEGNIWTTWGLANNTTNNDRVAMILQTLGGAPRVTGCLECHRGGVIAYTPMDLTTLLNMTLYHVYRLEIVPGVSVDAFVDDALIASEIVAGDVPVDQSYRARFFVHAEAGVNKELDVDYWKAWSE